MKEIRLNFPEDTEILKINVWDKNKKSFGRIKITSFTIIKMVEGKTTTFKVL